MMFNGNNEIVYTPILSSGMTVCSVLVKMWLSEVVEQSRSATLQGLPCGRVSQFILYCLIENDWSFYSDWEIFWNHFLIVNNDVYGELSLTLCGSTS